MKWIKKIKERGKIKQKMHHRFDIDDKTWEKIEPHLTGRRGQHTGIAKNNRKFINTVVWILRTGASWRDLLPWKIGDSASKIY